VLHSKQMEVTDMIIEKRIKDFEKLGFGMFVHFGLYSILESGEWIKHHDNIPFEQYRRLIGKFDPEPDWAKKLVATAKAAGCKYITLTTRHHEGFSLYDTCGLSDFDAPHSVARRDLVREFVNACNDEGIIPFFYHTLLDWSVPSYNDNFEEYLSYLRKSVELLCKNYGKIGGIWFDGTWDKPDADWEEDELYGLIRSYQPDAMIINNTGLTQRGALGHIELDSVTFERGKPSQINLSDSPKYIASEMCQTFGEHWGYAARDFKFKSLIEIIEDLCGCRRYGANYLLNVGPRSNGYLRPLDEAMLLSLGEWVNIQSEAIYQSRPADISVEGNSKDFILERDGAYYLFCHDLKIVGDINVTIGGDQVQSVDSFMMDRPIKSIEWLDDHTVVPFEQDNGRVRVFPPNFKYGTQLVVRIAKIEV